MFKKLLVCLVLGLLVSSPLVAEMTIELVEPVNGAVLVPCSDIMIKAEVTSTTEQIQRVYYYVNNVSKGYSTAEPWETDKWTAVPEGNYKVWAKVRDTDRNEVVSDTAYVKVGGISNGEKLINGNFSCNTTSGWTLDIYNEGNGEITLMDDGYFDDAFYVMYTSDAASTDWYVQFWQVVPVDSGHIYDVFFYADSDEPRSLTVGFQENVDPYRTHVWTTVEIDGADEYAIEGGMAIFSDPMNRFKFNLGGSDVPVYLDNIRVIDRSMSSVKSKELALDGSIKEFELHQAYPNPFNMTTTIRFSLSEAVDIQLDVYNMQGQKVRTLVNGEHAAGTHAIPWNGLNDSGHIVPSGVYLYRLSSSSAALNLSRKVVLLK